MLLLAAVGVTKQYDREPVLDRIVCEVRSGQRIALVGPNGAGKTTLLHLLAGLDTPDQGEIVRPQHVTVGLLQQQVPLSDGLTLWQAAEDGLRSILTWQQQAQQLVDELARATDPEIIARLSRHYDDVQQRLQMHDGFVWEHRIEEVLTGLGFSSSQFHQPLASLSGGQQNRVGLARLLLQQPDVLLLDEPTNHLDLGAIEWLEQMLTERQVTLVMVSHDRFFLDRVCTTTWELYRGRLTSYPGNFSRYWELRQERHLTLQRTAEKIEQQRQHAEEFIRRNHAGQNASRAKDRERKLARLEQIETLPEIPVPHFVFFPPSRTGDWVIEVQDLSHHFSHQPPLFERLSFRIQRGQRWGIVGPNGCGKTTLLRVLLGELTPTQGKVRWGSQVQVGYLDQQLSQIPPDLTVLEAIRPANWARFSDGQLRDLLARFGLTGDLALQRVSDLSGGERSKAALAKLAAHEPNVLILDEPTNHLDLWARAALEHALCQFTGTVLFVSHDRYFIDRVATHLLIWEAGRWQEFPGTYSLYHYQHRRQSTAVDGSAPSKSLGTAANKALRRQTETNRRRRKFPYRKLSDLEEEITQKETLLRELQQLLGDPEVHRDHLRSQKLLRDYESTQQELARLYEHWEEAVELNGD
ncbi:MAG: ABC transporter [Planctomycetaceae bacterium]|nr:MAG: ABC transporter [Planctomycetaceae bacterium]